jgi:O-acetyl-ADP-ribose deacetylase (regulator of RNase III)
MKDQIKLVKGDITQLKVDAIVNAANESLLDGCGVNGAIHQAAGPALLEECKTLGGCATGSAKITKGYSLPAKYVIHAVGPVWRGGAKGESKLLASCYAASLKLALENQIKTIAFPAVSCGIYGYPPGDAAAIAIKEIVHFLEQHPELETVYFVCFDDTIYEAYSHAVDSFHHE